MFKNTASQKAYFFAWDSTTGLPKTGDTANITAYVQKDYGAVTVLADTSADQMDATNSAGWYRFDLAQAETNADTLGFTAKSSTANIVVMGLPAVVFTRMAALNTEVAAIKAKTDSLTFTTALQVDANVRDFTPGAGLDGTGTDGDPFTIA